MVDPTSNVGEVEEADAPACAACGTAIVNDPDHAVLTYVDDEDVTHHRHFCSESCRDEWLTETDAV